MLTIGKAARAAELSIDTLRFYERSGLLKAPPRTAAGYRLYGPEDIARLRFIHRAKTLGFTLEEIAQLLQLNDGTGRRREVKAIAALRLNQLQQRIEELTRIRDALSHLVGACQADGPLQGCPIIEALQDAADRPSAASRKPTPSRHRFHP